MRFLSLDKKFVHQTKKTMDGRPLSAEGTAFPLFST
jgi:hypothetical protein